MLATKEQSEIVADNLANIKTPGFKEEQGILEPFNKVLLARLEGFVPDYVAKEIGNSSHGVAVSEVTRNMIMGPLNKTDRPEDLALGTQGFFAIQTPDGERYTRNGHFQLDGTGTLKTTEGFEVLGTNGVISGLSPSFTVRSDGTIIDKNVNIAKLRIVDMPVTNLKREGQSLYSAIQPPTLANVNTVQVLQGTIENSNVDLAGQMEKMIIVMRAYEANQKVIQTQDSILEKAVNEVGKL